MTFERTIPIGIYVVEEQAIYRHIYRSSFESENSFRLLGVSSNADQKTLSEALSNTKPDILLIGTKQFSSDLLAELEKVYLNYPRMGIILLLTAVKADETAIMRKLLQKCSSGIAIYLKQSLDNPEQLCGIIISVSRGQVVMDPAVATSILMEKSESPFMKQLTDRELEILNLLARGLTNQGIAETLFIDIKTVEHHLNSIYGKLKEKKDVNQKHPRVSVARMYLETTGELIPFNPRTATPLYSTS